MRTAKPNFSRYSKRFSPRSRTILRRCSIDSRCCKTRRRSHIQIGGGSDQCPFSGLASGSAAATLERAGCGSWIRLARGRHSNDFSAQRAHARSEYRQSLAMVKAPAGEEAQPFLHFLRMETPVFKPAPPDLGIQFSSQPVALGANRHWNWIGAIQLGSAGPPVIAEADGREVHLSLRCDTSLSRRSRCNTTIT